MMIAFWFIAIMVNLFLAAYDIHIKQYGWAVFAFGMFLISLWFFSFKMYQLP